MNDGRSILVPDLWRKPRRLKKGDRLAVLSPSSACPYLFPEIFDMGLENLRSLGLEIVEFPSARMSPEELYRNPKTRAEDLNQAFADDHVAGIVCSIGGYESVRMLEYLDMELILSHPKVIMGFSDASTFLSYLNQRGMVTLYGPSVMAGIAQMNHMPESFTQHMKEFLFEEWDGYAYQPYRQWTDGYKDWSCQDTLGECKEWTDNNEGWAFLQGSGPVEGRLWGGCIEVLEFLKGTRYYPSLDFFENTILFFESSEEKPSPRQIGYMLRNYGTQGVLQKVKGILFGRPKDYSAKEKDELHKVVTDIMQVELGLSHIPVVANLDFGHTDPKFILPLGCRAEINPLNRTFFLKESPFI